MQFWRSHPLDAVYPVLLIDMIVLKTLGARTVASIRWPRAGRRSSCTAPQLDPGRLHALRNLTFAAATNARADVSAPWVLHLHAGDCMKREQ